MAQEIVNEEVLLRTDGKGWNINLFVKNEKMRAFLCHGCASICKDATELGCDHEDEDIFIYCNDCLSQLIQQNDGKCPLNSHSEPMVIPSRSTRRQVLKSVVLCPNSISFKIRQSQNNNGNGIIDTAMSDEKEGVQKDIANKNDGCSWKGPFSDLIKKHLNECNKIHNKTFIENMKFNTLQNIVNKTELELKSLSTDIKSLQQKHDIDVGGINQKIDNIKQEIIVSLNKEINILRNEQQQGIKQMKDEIKDLKDVFQQKIELMQNEEKKQSSVMEYFEIPGTYVSISDDRKTMRKTNTGWCNTTYGAFGVDSTKSNVYIWTLTYNKNDNQSFVAIGITSGYGDINAQFYYNHKNKYYHFGMYSTDIKYDKKLEDKDTIKMILDLKSTVSTLRFVVNDVDTGTVNVSNDNGIVYKLAINCYYVQHAFTLTNFEIQ